MKFRSIYANIENFISMHFRPLSIWNFSYLIEKKEELVITTPGRVLISEILPENPKIRFSLINKVLSKKEVSNIIDIIYRHCGQTETVKFADKIWG